MLNIVFPTGVSQVSCPVSCSQCPCFTVGPFEFNIDENTPVGTSIATLTATPGSSITYSSELSVFNMDSVTGVLSVGESLDYETQSTYQFRVEAEEDTYQGRRDITITILNRNEFPPQCSEGLVHFSVLENQNSAFFQLPNCTDGDFLTAPVFTYYITNFSDDVFTVDDNGLFSILQPLDYETSDFYHLSIVVTDSDIPPGFMNTTIRAIVTVQPENEFSPVFAASQFTIEVSENTTIGSVIGRVNATDSDRGSDGMVVYTIAIGQTDVFVINEKTGCLILARTLDFETDISYHFSVVATDNSADIMSRQSATAGVTISVLDSNDNPPVFTSPFYHTEVSENTQPGTLLTQLACADLDSGINKELLYFITSGNEESHFNVGTSSGNVTLTSSLDYDNPTNSDFVALTIQCQEVAAPNRISSTQLLIIVTSYNMFNPQPNSIELTVSVPENATPGTLIATVVANDRDRGPGGILRYYINKDLMQSSSCRFEHIAIDETSGNVYLISPLDFEKGANEMYCVVTILDSGYPEKASRVDLFVSVTDVNDNKPKCFPSVSAVYIAEDSMIGGGTVFSLPCNDTDSPSLQYTILYPSFQPFDIDSTGSLILQSPLDYETEPFYLLSIQVSDGIFVTNVTIRVIVEPVNEHIPIFSRSVYYCSVEENSLIGTVLPCNIVASDQDSGMDGKVHYRLLSSGPFSFNYGDELVLTANIDFEDQHEFLLEIEAFDLGTPSLNSTTTVNVTVVDKNDNHPRMQRILSASISENSLNGTTVTNLTCTDLDQSLNGETEVELLNTFQLTNNEFVDITNLQRFGINASKVFVSSDFNFEISSQYKITVICSDHGVPRLFTTSTLLVNIDPENEYPPVFSNPSLSIAVSEGTNIGTVIATVTATDQDSGEHGRINFSLLSTTDEQLPFDISESFGEIILWNPLNCELKVQYTFYVVAEDGGLPSLSSQSISMINVTNCHLGNVVPDYYTYSMNVVENTALGEAVGSISCSSARVNVSTDIRPMFRFVNSDSSNFQIDSTNGEITIVNSPDFELQSNYKIVVECYDPNYTSVASNVSVFIRVLPVNEFVPEFSDNNIRLNVTENSPYGTLIFQLLASDQDHGLDGQVEFLIASEDSFKAIVNQHTGEVYLATSLDRETTNEITFTAIARDSSANETLRKSTTILVTITVRDENDNWPQCAPIVHHLVVSPRTEPPYEMVGTFACTDSDINENAQLMYQFSDDLVPADLFELQSDSLYLTGKLNTSGPSHYYLPISVRDRGTPSLASNVLVIVDVQEPDVIGADSSDHAALVEVEGLKNAVWIQLRNISLVLVSLKLLTCIHNYDTCGHCISFSMQIHSDHHKFMHGMQAS